MSGLSVALVVNTCDQPEYLARILRALGAQSSPPAAVILSSLMTARDSETRQVFDRWRSGKPFPHSSRLAGENRIPPFARLERRHRGGRGGLPGLP